MFKKILGMAVCAAVAASLAIPVGAAADTKYKEKVLRGLGVYQENPVTYDNFINSLAGFLYENPGDAGSAEYIARTTGMIESDEEYSGQTALTVGKACELAVITLGYKPAVGADGNYMQKASELGIADGLSANGEDRLKQDVAVEILYDMIDAAPLVKTYEGKQTPQYAVAYDENLLSLNRDIYKIKGLVTGTEITSIYGEEYVAKNDCIAIDDTSYFVGDVNYDDLLGKNVIAYIRESDWERDEILYVGEVESKNKITNVACDDIADIGEDISYITYYDAPHKTKKLNIVASPRVIYNGMFLEDYTEDDFRQGELELIDFNSDNRYDVIKVLAYETIIVESVDSREMIIRNRYRFADCISELELNRMKNEDVIFRIFDENGDEVEFSAIKTDDVLSVAMSRDRKIIDVLISAKETAEGSVTGVDDAEDLVYINGEEYEKSEDFNKFLINTEKNIMLGNTYTFYFDRFGKIAYIKEKTYKDYNAIAKVVYDEDRDEYVIDHMDINGDWYTSAVYEKVKIDGVKPASLEAEMEILKDEGPQIVLLKLNAEKQIISIDKAGRHNGQNDSEFCKKTATKYFYRSDDRYFHSGTDVIYLEDDAKVIVIPSENVKDRDNWRVYSAGSFFASNREYTIDCFNPDEFMFTDLVTAVQSDDVTKAKAGKALYVVTGFEWVLVDDEVRPLIKGSVDGFMNLSFVGKEQNIFNGIKVGDVINFALDQEGRIDYVEKKFSLIDFTKKTGAIYDETSLHSGTVIDINCEEGKLMLDCGTPVPFRLSPTMQVTVYEDGECESKPISGIARDDEILVRTSYGKVVELVCVKK